MTTQAPQGHFEPNLAAKPDARINGVYDLPAPNRIAGWAIDRADPEAAVEVEIYRDGALVRRIRADRNRPDLERAGIGTGNYGFSVELDQPVAPGMAFTLSARAVTRDGVAGPLRATGKAGPSDDPHLALLERSYRETTALRAEIAGLRRAVDAKVAPQDHNDRDADVQATAAILDRIELVQARLDGVAAATATPAEPEVGAGLRIAVGVALAMSTLAVVLGLWSVFG